MSSQKTKPGPLLQKLGQLFEARRTFRPRLAAITGNPDALVIRNLEGTHSFQQELANPTETGAAKGLRIAFWNASDRGAVACAASSSTFKKPIKDTARSYRICRFVRMTDMNSKAERPLRPPLRQDRIVSEWPRHFLSESSNST